MGEPLELWSVAPSPRGEPGYPRLVADDGRLEIQQRGGTRRTFRIPDDISAAAVHEESSKLVLRGPSGDSVLTLDPEQWVPKLEQLDDRGWEDVDLDGQADSRRLPRRFARLLARIEVPLWTVELTGASLRRGEQRGRSLRARLSVAAATGMIGAPTLAALSLIIVVVGSWEPVDAVMLPLGLSVAALAALWAVVYVLSLRWSLWFPNRHRADRPGAAVLRPQPQVPVDAALAHRTLIAVTPDAVSVVLRGREVRYPRHYPFGVHRIELMTLDGRPVQFALTGPDGVAVDTFVWAWWFPDRDTERLRAFAREAGLELTETSLAKGPGERFDPDETAPEPVALGHWAISPLLVALPLLASAYAVWLSTASDTYQWFSDAAFGLGVAGVVACLAGAVITTVDKYRADRRVVPAASAKPA